MSGIFGLIGFGLFLSACWYFFCGRLEALEESNRKLWARVWALEDRVEVLEPEKEAK